MSGNNNEVPQPRVSQEQFKGALQALDHGKKPDVIPSLKVILQADRQIKTDNSEGLPNGLASIPEVAKVLAELRFTGTVEQALKKGRINHKEEAGLHPEEVKRLRLLFGYKDRKVSRKSFLQAAAVGTMALLTGASPHQLTQSGEAPAPVVAATEPEVIAPPPPPTVEATPPPVVAAAPIKPRITPSPAPREAPTQKPTTREPAPSKLAPSPEIKPPSKEERILHPAELSYEEVRPWIGKLRNTHDSVLTESLFTTELGGMNPEARERVLDAIALAHAKSLIQHYGNTETIIGLDPGHGGSDIGSGAGGLAEKELTWQVASKIADKLFEITKGKYRIIFLRPKEPNDEDLDKEPGISNVERIQKRKAQLVKMESELRKNNPESIGKNIVYLSVHFNGGSPGDHGAEVYYPNEVGMENETYRAGSEKLAKILQQNIVKEITETGYPVKNRGAIMDPDKRPAGPNSDIVLGPYLALGSEKLDRVLKSA